MASTVTGSQKPDVSIFREALRRTGSDPASSVHMGDNYIADVLGARAAGIDGVLVDRSRRGQPGMFDFALRDGLGGTTGSPSTARWSATSASSSPSSTSRAGPR